MYRINVPLEERVLVLSSNLFFSMLESVLLAEIAGKIQTCYFEKGETIFLENSSNTGFHILQKGLVKLFQSSPTGRELVMSVLGEGSIFNLVAVLDGGQSPVNAIALEESNVWILDREIILTYMNQQPGLNQKVIQSLCWNLRNVTDMVGELSFYQITNRLARLLIKLPPERLYGKGSHRFTQEEIAKNLGTVREVVSRSLRELEKSGAIKVSRVGIQIVNKETLGFWVQKSEETVSDL